MLGKRTIQVLVAVLALCALGISQGIAAEKRENVIGASYYEIGEATDFGTRDGGYAVSYQRWYNDSVAWTVEAAKSDAGTVIPFDSQLLTFGGAKKVGDGAFYFPFVLNALKVDDDQGDYVYGAGVGAGIDFKAGNHLGFQIEGLYRYFTVSDSLPARDLSTVAARFCIRF